MDDLGRFIKQFLFLTVILLGFINVVTAQRRHGMTCLYCATGCNNVTGTCETCLDGLHGPTCEQMCKTTCRTCDKTTGNCVTCLDGWHGEDCSQQCTNCQICEKASGRCTLCLPTLWGDACENFCPKNCHACNVTNGECLVCAIGFYGENCNNQCGNCKRSICEKQSGECLYECFDGWHGLGCDKPCEKNCLMCDKVTGDCHMCHMGKWGRAACDFDCGPNCDFCNVTTGQCIECAQGYYGKDCQEKCGQCHQTVCEKETGTCMYQCNEGYFGLKCEDKCMENCSRCSFKDSCQVCNSGLVGPKCDMKCPDICASCHLDEFTNTIVCSKCKAEKRLPHRNCTCSDKKCTRFTQPWLGREMACEECESGTGWFLHYGTCCPCLHCKGGISQCASNGTCLQGCERGYYPATEGCHQRCDIEHCVWCEPFFSYTKVCVGCEDGYYPHGGVCTACNVNCKDSLCNNKTGECVNGCQDGWFGSRCDAKCDDAVCKECDSNAGYCSVCKDGFWGKHCQSKCPANCVKCDKGTGECMQCTGQLIGSDCSGACKNCLSELCNNNGECALGCKDGHYGIKCDQKCMPGCKICENSIACYECDPGFLIHEGQCKGHCKNCSNMDCDGTGVCRSGCIDGHFGQTCDSLCSPGCKACVDSNTCQTCGTGFNLIENRCIPTCEYCVNSTCDASGNCLHGCLNTWFGQKCDSKCIVGCDVCSSAETCTKCNSSYKLTADVCVSLCHNCIFEQCNTQQECYMGCKEGWYGSKCGFKCPVGCLECTGPDVCLSCIHGFSLERSSRQCVSQCLNCRNKACDVAKECLEGCNNGWFDRKCDRKCPDGCLNCTSESSCGACTHGYTLLNNTCTRKCGNCKDNSCNDQGLCIAGCRSGWYGDKCHLKCSQNCQSCQTQNTCTGCVDGRHGVQCEQLCPTSCRTCGANQSTGSIDCFTCNDGYDNPEKKCSCTNTKCVKFSSAFNTHECLQCTEGWFPSATGKCCPCLHCAGGNANCNGSRACPSGCDVGWTSANTGCDVPCSIQGCVSCLLDASGKVQCGKCQEGLFPDNKGKCIPCSRHCGGSKGLCNGTSGTCLEGCEPGWKGDKCNSAYIRIPFVSVCPDSCSQCNRSSGMCQACNDGYWGGHCEKECSSTCQKGCNQQTGSCYTSCSRYCYIKKDNNPPCNITTGHCYHGCVNGWRGSECRDKCGIHCFDHSCDRVSGDCTKGCDQGWQGPKCSETKAMIVLPSVGLIAGGVTAAIVFIFLMTMLIFFIYKCRAKKAEGEDHTEVVRYPHTAHVNNGMLMDSVM